MKNKTKNALPSNAFLLSQLRQMEIIDISEGKRLGFVGDVIFNDDFTRIEALVIPLQSSIISMFKKKDEIIIKWSQIKVIGVDIILVNTLEEDNNTENADRDYIDTL